MYDRIIPKIADQVRGIIHFGAHLGQEAELYERCGIKRVAWVEPNPYVLPSLREKVEPLGHLVIPVAVDYFPSGEGDAPFYVSSNEGQSSSLYTFNTHSKRYPSITMAQTIRVTTRMPLQIVREYELWDCNLWYFDIQGGEYAALKSAHDTATLDSVDFIYAEVQFEPLYMGTHLVGDIDRLLPDFNCRAIMDTGYGWGEAFYERYRHTGVGMLNRAKHEIQA